MTREITGSRNTNGRTDITNTTGTYQGHAYLNDFQNTFDTGNRRCFQKTTSEEYYKVYHENTDYNQKRN